jgi:hypothetical protein
LQESSDVELEFVYRWTQDGTPVTAKIARAALIWELTEFSQFLVAATTAGNAATFSL